MRNGYFNVTLGALTTAVTWETAGEIMSVVVGVITFFYLVGCIRYKMLEIKKITKEIEREDERE